MEFTDRGTEVASGTCVLTACPSYKGFYTFKQGANNYDIFILGCDLCLH